MKISRREQLAIVLAAERAPGDGVAAVGAAQLHEHHMRQCNDAQQAARNARWVAIGMTTLAVKNGLQPRLFSRAVAEIACEMLIAKKHMNVINAADWIDIVEKRAECLTHPVYVAAHAVARAALHQHVIDMCPTCGGKKEIPDHDIPDLNGVQPMKMCPDCNGTGKRRYTDEECADAVIGHVDRKHAREQINDALETIQRCEVMAIRHWSKILK